MKKFLIFAVALALSLNAGAQSFLGGTVGFSANSGSFSIALSPDLGWFLSEKTVIGVRPSLSFARADEDRTQVSFGVTPFVQYKLFQYSRFCLWAEGDAFFNWTTNRYLAEEVHRSFRYGLQAMPVLTFALSDHLRLQSRLGMFSLYVSGSENDGSHTFNSGFSVSSADVISILNGATIGFVYLF